ncbi:hypothetical protein ACIQXD_35315 [Streptomyces uncialis]|uniref:hypothetical protein n=1 Tax=Streptomyces uncialis TaxID=1048205 RepID=UPI00380114D4
MRPQWAWYALVLASVYRMTAADLAVAVQRTVRVASQTRVESHSVLRVTTHRIAAPAAQPTGRCPVPPVTYPPPQETAP